MKCTDRMNAVLNGRNADRYPFVPSIYEHGARLIGKSPCETSRSASLMAEAALKAWELYKHDLVTVGIDIYNIEAEAFGCEVSKDYDRAIPGIKSHPLSASPVFEPGRLEIPQPGESNRLQLITDASRAVFDEIGSQVWIYACMGGPFSQAVELRGFENLVNDMMETPEMLHRLMDKTAELSIQQARRLSEQGCGVNIFESWATLPLISPEIFGQYVVPYNKRVIEEIRRNYKTPPPAVIMGGNTALLMDHFIEVGTSLVVADYMTDFTLMKKKSKGRKMIIRGCVDPKMIERREWEGIESRVNALAEKAKGMKNFVWGCGCVSLDTTVDDVLKFKKMCLDAEQKVKKGKA